MTDFDWHDDESVCVPEQRAIACYRNTHGEIVIRQERTWSSEEDSVVVVARQHVVALAYALLDAAGLDMEIIECSPGGANSDVERPETRMVVARPDIDWPSVHQQFDAFRDAERSGTDASRSSRQERRARVEAALRAGPTRSNRAIAAEAGVSDKTVASIRAELSAESGAEFRTSGAEFRAEGAEFDAEFRTRGAEFGAEFRTSDPETPQSDSETPQHGEAPTLLE